jgi:hypothetical protein
MVPISIDLAAEKVALADRAAPAAAAGLSRAAHARGAALATGRL